MTRLSGIGSSLSTSLNTAAILAILVNSVDWLPVPISGLDTCAGSLSKTFAWKEKSPSFTLLSTWVCSTVPAVLLLKAHSDSTRPGFSLEQRSALLGLRTLSDATQTIAEVNPLVTERSSMANIKSLSDLNGEGDGDDNRKHNDYYAGGEKRYELLNRVQGLPAIVVQWSKHSIS